MSFPNRNYFTLEKTTPDVVEEVKRISAKMAELGITRKVQDPNNLELDDLNQKWEYTEDFADYRTEAFRHLYWHVDMETGELKKFSSRRMTRRAKRRDEEFEKMRKVWTDNGGDPDKFFGHIFVQTMANVILEFKIIKWVLKDFQKDFQKDYPESVGQRIEVPIPVKEVQRLADLEHEKLEKEGDHTYEDIARFIYGTEKYKYESRNDRLLSKRLVHYEIMTDTGHLTSFFMDVVRHCAQDSNMTMEQVAENHSMLFGLVVEGTRDEDFDDPEEYLKSKSETEIEEYDQMARIVSRLLRLEIVKQKEGVQ